MPKSVPLTEQGGTVTVFTSAARTATENSAVFHSDGNRGVHLVIDATAAADTPSVVFTLQGYSGLGDDYYTLLASAAITGTGTTVLRVFPGSTVTANLAANDTMPPRWRVIATHADTDSITYSVTANLLP